MAKIITRRKWLWIKRFLKNMYYWRINFSVFIKKFGIIVELFLCLNKILFLTNKNIEKNRKLKLVYLIIYTRVEKSKSLSTWNCTRVYQQWKYGIFAAVNTEVSTWIFSIIIVKQWAFSEIQWPVCDNHLMIN